ncbi:MAG: DNA polymerase III subunit delta', partial [Candidatus Aminicenantales bacterium]
MAFKDVLGNDRQKKILRRALRKGRIPNSLLFCGLDGVGKRSTALVLAKAMNCEKSSDDACEACPSCRAISRGVFPDVMVVSPEKNVIKIDQMRILKQTAYLKPMTGKKRFFIVTEAEKMNDEASNSLLKILEEPPHFSHIILISSNPDMLKPTIKSRCQTLHFQPISKEDIEKILLEKGFGKEKAKIISLLV